MMSTFQFALVLVRGIGLYMVATACVPLVGETFQIVVTRPVAPEQVWTYVYGYLHWLLTGGVGLLFLLKTTLFARLLARGTYPDGNCQRCGYTLAGSHATRCPECGDAGSTGVKGPEEMR